MKTFHGYDRLVLVSAGALMLSMLARGVVAKDLISGPEWAVAGVMVAGGGGVTFFLHPHVVRLPEVGFSTNENEGEKKAYDGLFPYPLILPGFYSLKLGFG